MQMDFFRPTVRIMLVLPQAAKLSIHFFAKEKQYCYTSSRGLIKGTTLINRRDEKSRVPSGNGMGFAPQSCAIPLCYKFL